MKPENLNLQSDCYMIVGDLRKLVKKDWGIAHVLMRYLGEEAESVDFTISSIFEPHERPVSNEQRMVEALHRAFTRITEELLRRDKR